MGDAAIVDDLITTERVYLVARRLALGETATTFEIADWIGVTRQAAWSMLTKMSRVGPLVLVDGRWVDLDAARQSGVGNDLLCFCQED